MNTRFVAGFGLALSLGIGAFAQADEPSAPIPPPAPATPAAPAPPAAAPQLPGGVKLDPVVQKAIGILGDMVRGEVSVNSNYSRGEVSFFKHYEMQIRTTKTGYRAVHLHKGTVINPRGATLTNGQRVNIRGVAQSDGSLNADEITVVQ